MAVVLVVGLCIPSTGFAANDETQGSTSTQAIESSSSSQAASTSSSGTVADEEAEGSIAPQAEGAKSAPAAAGTSSTQTTPSVPENKQLSPQSEDDWANVEDTFTVEAIQQFIKDPAFAQAVYDNISSAIQNDEYHIDKANICDPEGYSDLWPEPLTVEEILDEGTEGDDLVIAILENYVGPIFADRKGITDITGYPYLKNSTSIDFQYNLITDLSIFTGGVVAGSYNFNANPVNKWPKTFPNTIRAATHSIATTYTVTTAPLAYRFGDTVTPTLTYDVYYPDENGVLGTNSNWYSKYWSSTTAYGSSVPALPQTNGSSSITLPTCSLEGSATIEIGLTGTKDIEDLDNWEDNLSNAVTYTSGMSTNETGGTPGQGNSPSYRFGVVTQRYATLNITGEAEVTGGFTFTKTSATSGKPVAGAEYTLYENDGVTVAGGPYTTNDEGVIAEGGFVPGTYILKETKAADGYTINTEPITITITDPGATTSVAGGVASFERDVAEPDVKAVWGTLKATNGVWNKTTTTTTTTAESLSADALLTNKGNVGYKVLSSLKAEFNGSADAYEGSDEIVVKMGGETYGTYSSDDAALAAINAIVNGKKLTGDLTIEYKGTYEEKAGHYTATAAQTDTALPVNLSFSAEKTFDGTLSGVQGAFGNFEFTATGIGENGATLNNPVYNDANGKVNFGEMSFTKPGTYEFIFAETQGADPDTQYAGTTHKVKVIVTEGSGGVSAQVVMDGTVVGTYTGTDTNTVDGAGTIAAKPIDINAGTFENHLKKPTATLSASKAVDLGSLTNDQFTFSLVPGADCKDVTYLDVTQTEHPLPADGWTAISNENGTVDFDAAFSALAFPRAEGTYHFTLTENDTPAGSAYNKDATSVSVTVTVTKNATTGKYEAAVSYDGTDTAPTFKNAFKRTTLSASKVVAAGGNDADDFEFTLTFDAGTSGLTLPADGLKGITLGADNTATITKVNGVAASTIGATDPVLSVTYTVKGGQQLALAGVPVGLGYTVTEATNSLYYANTDKTGTVEADGSSVSVSNQVKTGDVYVSKAVTGLHSSTDDSFSFTMNLNITTGYAWTNRTYNISKDGGLTWGDSVTVDTGATSLSFDLKDGWMARVNKLPVGTYTTVETADTTYTATPEQQVVVLDQDNIHHEEGAKVDFTNTKKPPTPAAVSLAAAKTVDGNVPQTITTGYANGAYTTAPFAGAFSFALSQVGALPAGAAAPTGTAQTATNTASGAVSFAEIGNLTAEGDYTFQVTETTADTAYVDADGSTYKAVVHVSYNDKADAGNHDYKGDSVDTANSLYVDKITWTKNGASTDSAAFDNKKIAPTPIEASLDVSKTLDGKVPAAGAFSFTVTAAEGTPMPVNTTASNLADGSVDFGGIEFEAPGTFTYTITESAVTDKTVAGDSRTYEAVVTVTDDGTNTLSAAITYTASAATDSTGAASATDKAAFVNRTYAPSYAMAKFRTTDASEFGGTGAFGFVPGTKDVTYKVAVVNTGDLPLTMDVNDTFTTGTANFENVKFTAGTGYTGKAFTTTTTATLADITTIEAGAADAATLVNSGLGTDTVNVTIQPGSTIVLTITADVTESAQAALDDTSADDATNPKTNTQGYTNTARTSKVEATYTKDGQTVTLTKDDFPAGSTAAAALGDQTDTAKTPVQPTPNYTMSKTRVTTAPAKEGTSKFAFFHGDTVTYSVEVQNTGNMPLTMAVADAFTDAGYFSTPTATAVTGTGVTTTATLPTTDPVEVAIPAGATATLTFTGVVDNSAPENLSDTADDQGMGYVNTATTTQVESTYTKPDGTEGTIDATNFPDELGDKNDTATTPVQKAVGTSLAIPVTKTIAGGTPALDDAFTFTLAAKTAGAPLPAVTTTAVLGAGQGLFGSITYTQAGTYEYTVTENAGSNTRYTYDASNYTYSVAVTEVNGQLQTATSISKDGATAEKIEFTNNYNDEPGKLEVEKIGKTTKADAGDELSWDIVVENPESFDIYGVWVKDTAPQYTTLTETAGDDQGKVITEGTTQYATWFIPVLKAGQSVTLTLKATVNADVPDGTVITNVAHYQATGNPTEPTDTTPTPKDPTNPVGTPTVNPSVPSSSSTSSTSTKSSSTVTTTTTTAATATAATAATTATAAASAKTGDSAPIVPVAVALAIGGIAAVTARRRLKD